MGYDMNTHEPQVLERTHKGHQMGLGGLGDILQFEDKVRVKINRTVARSRQEDVYLCGKMIADLLLQQWHWCNQ